MDTAREIILVKSGGAAAMSQWYHAFAELAPDLDVRWWDDASVDPDAVRYVLVWQPEPGRIARYRNLRVIFSSGAGVDHITSDPDLPRHLPIVRMASDETIQTVCEYVCLGVLAIQRDLRRLIAAQAACLWEEFEPPCFSGMAALETFLAQTDILVGLLPDTAETRGLLNALRVAMLPAVPAWLTLIVLSDLIAAWIRGT